MTIARLFGAVLLALFLAVVPALALDIHAPANPQFDTPAPPSHSAAKWVLLLGAVGLAGTVTVQYLAFPGFTAGTVAPSAAQMANRTQLIAQVGAGADSDTTATVTHNWGLSAADTASGYPQVGIVPEPGGTAFAGWSVGARAANSLTLTKQSTVTGSGGTVTVTLIRYAVSSVSGRT